MWGYSLQFWQVVVFWLWAASAVGGGVAVVAALGSSVISYYISDATQKAADAEVANAKATGEQARAEAAVANEGAKRADQRIAELNLEIAKMRSPRSIDAIKGEAIIAAVSKYAGTPFDMAVTEGDPEALALQENIETLLLGSGWAHKPWAGFGFHSFRRGRAEFGFVTTNEVAVMVHSERTEQLLLQATALANALIAAEIPTRITRETWSNDGANLNPLSFDNVHIVVGKKVN